LLRTDTASPAIQPALTAGFSTDDYFPAEYSPSLPFFSLTISKSAVVCRRLVATEVHPQSYGWSTKKGEDIDQSRIKTLGPAFKFAWLEGSITY
jgi:hypothetical protein